MIAESPDYVLGTRLLGIVFNKMDFLRDLCEGDIYLIEAFFFLLTLFQFGLTIAPIQNSGLINAKYNNALYGTIIIWYNK